MRSKVNCKGRDLPLKNNGMRLIGYESEEKRLDHMLLKESIWGQRATAKEETFAFTEPLKNNGMRLIGYESEENPYFI